MLPAFLATLGFALSAVCAHRATKLIGGTEANFWRLVLATICLAVWAHAFGQGLSGDAFPVFILSGFVGIGLGDVAMFQALPRLGSRLTSLLLNCFSTPFAALIEWLWLGTRLSAAQIGCDAVILAGVALALTPSRHLTFAPGQLRRGVFFSVVAAGGNALGMVISRRAYEVAQQAGEHIDGGTAAYQRLIGGLFLAGLFLLVAKRKHVAEALALSPAPPGHTLWEKWRQAGPWVFANSFTGMTLGVSCLQWALKTTPTGIVLPIVAITPLVVIPFARKLENERPSRRSLIGTGIAVAGAVALTLVS